MAVQWPKLRWLYIPLLVLWALVCGLRPITAGMSSSNNNDVEPMLSDQIQEQQQQQQRIQTFSLFHEPGCAHCRKIVPAYRSLAEELSSNLVVEEQEVFSKVDFQEFDVQSTEAKSEAEKLGVERFPTLL